MSRAHFFTFTNKFWYPKVTNSPPPPPQKEYHRSVSKTETDDSMFTYWTKVFVAFATDNFMYLVIK